MLVDIFDHFSHFVLVYLKGVPGSFFLQFAQYSVEDRSGGIAVSGLFPVPNVKEGAKKIAVQLGVVGAEGKEIVPLITSLYFEMDDIEMLGFVIQGVFKILWNIGDGIICHMGGDTVVDKGSVPFEPKGEGVKGTGIGVSERPIPGELQNRQDTE